MNEEFKDPNQLDLFAGMFLTPDQEESKRKYIERCENAAKLAESTNQHNMALLLENGFVLGVDFVNTFKRVLNPDNLLETTSKYYIRRHKVFTNIFIKSKGLFQFAVHLPHNSRPFGIIHLSHV